MIDLAHQRKCSRARADGLHTAKASGQDEHLKVCRIQLCKRAVRLDAHAMTCLDQRISDRGKLHFHTAAPQNITGRNRFQRLKAGSENHSNHFYSSRHCFTYE